MDGIKISTDKENLDLLFISNFISESYWAKGRTMEEMQLCIDHSLNFGVYISERQIAYARIVTDYVQFAYLMDLFVSDAYRGHGCATHLMRYILNYSSLSSVKVWRLATRDAHELYARFGFKSLANPEKMMELIKTDII